MFHRLVVCAALASTTLACSDEHDHHEETGLGDVVFVGGATDEALAVMLDKPAKDVASERLSFTSPEALATLSKDTPTAIEFQHASVRAVRSVREPAPFQPLSPRQRLLADLKSLVRPIGIAHAHGEPFNGNGYFLLFSDAAKKEFLRVFTDQTSYTPEATAWAGLATGQQPITVSLTWATFEENAVPADGGPFVGGSVAFSVR